MFYSNIEGLQPKVLFPVSVLNQAFHVTPRVAVFVASLLGGEERAKCFRRDVGNRKIICIQSKFRECSASVYLSVNKSGLGVGGARGGGVGRRGSQGSLCLGC